MGALRAPRRSRNRVCRPASEARAVARLHWARRRVADREGGIMSVADEIETVVIGKLPDAVVKVGGDGYRWELEVVSVAFEGMSAVKRQQLVYGAIGGLIKSGAVHAVTIQARTPTEASARGGAT